MDPTLRELRYGKQDEEIEAIVRLKPGHELPYGVRPVAWFGDVVTCRLQRQAIDATWESEALLSVKAPRLFGMEPMVEWSAQEVDGESLSLKAADIRRPHGIEATGRGVIVAVVDWGFDFAHPNFCNPDGTTRALAIWDQSATGLSPEPYGYGRVFTREEINAALNSDDPYQALGYHPASGDPRKTGSHGCHVHDIAAGNGRVPGSPVGIAPEADLLFVHLANRGTGGRANLGDSVTLLEALDWIRWQACDQPWVVNLSIGKHGGPHTGDTLVEQGIDALLLEMPGRFIGHSVGNYHHAQAHAMGQLRPGQSRSIHWITDKADITPNELEVWYSGRDNISVTLLSPGGQYEYSVALGKDLSIEVSGEEVGHIYNRAIDPANGDNHMDIFLYPAAPSGRWAVILRGEDIVDGRYHCWVERDAACLKCQSRLAPEDVIPHVTTGTICNGFRSIAVGAYDAHSPRRPVAAFSSAGPTRDGRLKPDLIAPGVQVLAARSSLPELGADTPKLKRYSGTSMASPHVVGTVALMFEVAGRRLTIQETRRLLLSSTEEADLDAEDVDRIGSGYLDTVAAVKTTLGYVSEAEGEVFSTSYSDTKSQISSLARGQGRYSADDLSPDQEEGVFASRRVNNDQDETNSQVPIFEVVKHYPFTLFVDHEGSDISASTVFDALIGGYGPAVMRNFAERFEVVGYPGDRLNLPLCEGDTVISRGEGGLAHVFTISDASLMSPSSPVICNPIAERGDNGFDLSAFDPIVGHLNSQVARQFSNLECKLPFNQIVVRPRQPMRGSEAVERRVQLRHSAGDDLIESIGDGSPFVNLALSQSWNRFQRFKRLATQAGNPNVLSASRIRSETNVRVDPNPYYSIMRHEISAVIRAAFNSWQMPEILLAIWSREGSTRSVTNYRPVPAASSEVNAATLFRCQVYYEDLGADHFIITRYDPVGGDNVWDNTDAMAARHERHFSDQVRALYSAGLLPEDISAAINGELHVRRVHSGFAVFPSVKFYALSLLLVDALYTQMQRNSFSQLNSVSPVLNYLQWNMGTVRFRQFLASAELHRHERAYRMVSGDAISIEQWALHTRPKPMEWYQARINAICFMHLVKVYQPVFIPSLTLIKPGIEDLPGYGSRIAYV